MCESDRRTKTWLINSYSQQSRFAVVTYQLLWHVTCNKCMSTQCISEGIRTHACRVSKYPGQRKTLASLAVYILNIFHSVWCVCRSKSHALLSKMPNNTMCTNTCSLDFNADLVKKQKNKKQKQSNTLAAAYCPDTFHTGCWIWNKHLAM